MGRPGLAGGRDDSFFPVRATLLAAAAEAGWCPAARARRSLSFAFGRSVSAAMRAPARPDPAGTVRA